MQNPDNHVRILVIDDDPSVFDMVEGALKFFEDISWSIVAYAASKIEADDALKNGEELGFTHVLLDANLGTSDKEGFEIAQEIIARFPHACIIGISSKNQDEMDPSNRVADMTKYVDKYVGKQITDRNIFRSAIESTLTN